MILSIRKIGDPILKFKCWEINRTKSEFNSIHYYRKLMSDMVETAIAKDAVGLAANQIGDIDKLFIFSDFSLVGKLVSREFKMAINPSFEPLTRETNVEEEGCLSVPNILATVKRYTHIKANYLNEYGEPIEETLTGLTARVFQHELEHVQGKNFLENAIKIFYQK